MPMPDFNHPVCQAAGICFAEHLTFYLFTGQLPAGQRDSRDWLRLLMKDQLTKLAEILEMALREPAYSHPDLPELLLLLAFLETGKRQPIKVNDLPDMMQWLLAICQLELYVQQGYIKLYGHWRITEPDDDDHYAELTEDGYKVACEPAAPPFIRKLQQRADSKNWN